MNIEINNKQINNDNSIIENFSDAGLVEVGTASKDSDKAISNKNVIISLVSVLLGLPIIIFIIYYLIKRRDKLGPTGIAAKYAMAPGIYATKKVLGAVEAIDQTVIKKGLSPAKSWIIDKVGLTNFFKSEFYFFIKQYLYFFILLTICFYIIIYLSNSSNPTTKSEAKVFFYLFLLVLFMIITEIIKTPQENLNKFMIIIAFSLILNYVLCKLINKYIKEGFWKKYGMVIGFNLIVYVLTIVIIYALFTTKANDLYSSCSSAIKNNLGFLLYFTLYLHILYTVFKSLNANNNLAIILQPMLVGLLLILFIYSIIIYIAVKSKLINKNQMLNAFIVLLSISAFLGLMQVYIMMRSLGTVCKIDEPPKDDSKKENIILLILLSVVIILWYDDERNWHRLGSILFVIITLFTIYVFFVYSAKHPSIGLLSLYLFIEWYILFTYRKLNSKNAFHFIFMKT